MANRTSKLAIFFYNMIFALGCLGLLAGGAFMVFAYGWYSLGPQMRDSKEWIHTDCLILDYEEDQGTNSYGVRDRLFFKVNFLDVLAAVATATLDQGWSSPEVPC